MDKQRGLCLAGVISVPFLTMAARLLLAPWLSLNDALGVFVVPVSMAAWCGGGGTGLASLALSTLLCRLFLPVEGGPLLLFSLSCLPLCALAEMVHRSRRMLTGEVIRRVQADEEKDRMFAVLVHELRNPLSAMSNALHLMKMTGSAGEKPLRMAELATTQMGHLIDDLMDVNRIARGRVQLRYQSFELAELLEALVPPHAEAAAARGLALTMEAAEPAVVFADPVRLSQVFGNLIGNAVKFTDQGGVTVRLYRRGRSACVSVADTGIGIAPEALAAIWEPFRQERARGGLGLGLSVVRGLVEVHGGSVTVASEPHRGTTFTVELPLEEGIRPRGTRAF